MSISFRALAASVLSRGRECEACGRDFKCGVSLSGCWCSEIELNEETRIELRRRYRDCLCRDCLEQISRAAKSGKSSGPE